MVIVLESNIRSSPTRRYRDDDLDGYSVLVDVVAVGASNTNEQGVCGKRLTITFLPARCSSPYGLLLFQSQARLKKPVITVFLY
jgi:hypothetical protein